MHSMSNLFERISDTKYHRLTFLRKHCMLEMKKEMFIYTTQSVLKIPMLFLNQVMKTPEAFPKTKLIRFFVIKKFQWY